MKRLFLSSVLFFCIATVAHAQEVHQDLKETVTARVVSIVSEREQVIVGTETTTIVQQVRVQLTSGPSKAKIVEFENDVSPLSVGDKIYVNHLIFINGAELYQLKDFDRRTMLIVLSVLFVAVLAAIAGLQGIRAFVSLIASVGIIAFILVPLLLKGYSPVLVSTAVAGLILTIAILATHGFRPLSYIALFGTISAVCVTSLIASASVSLMHLTGFASDASVYLNFSTHGSLDFSGLLLGGMIIGVLGVLDDVAITQASVAMELVRANASLRGIDLYRRALRVGRDHIGSLVNTLALAYIGVQLPLILLFARTDSPLTTILNQEVVASELVRTLVGSIGLMLAVPFTTLIAVWWIGRFGVEREKHGGQTHGHTHSH